MPKTYKKRSSSLRPPPSSSLPQTPPSLLKDMENMLITDVHYRNILKCTRNPEKSDINIVKNSAGGGWRDDFYLDDHWPLDDYLEENPLSSIPERFCGSTYETPLTLYILNMEEIALFTNNRAILARDPSHKYNILHWIIGSFIPTQTTTFSAIKNHGKEATLQISYHEIDMGSFSYQVSQANNVNTKKNRLTSLFSRSKEPERSEKIIALEEESIQIKHGENYIDMSEITEDSIALYQAISSSLDENEIGNLLMTQDNQANTPFHLLLMRSTEITDEQTPYDDLLAHLLSEDEHVARLSNKAKVKLLCTQNNDGNNILHMIEDCHGEGLWMMIYDAFGMDAFFRATNQLNDNHHRPIDISKTYPFELIDLSPNSEPDEEPAEESKNVPDEETLTATPVSNTYEGELTMVSVNDTDERELTMAPVNDTNIDENPISQYLQRAVIDQLSSMQRLAANEGGIISLETLSKFAHSPTELLYQFNDRPSIFATIIANQPLELIRYCIENILSPWELYDFCHGNPREVKASIAHNPNISFPEWKSLYDSQTIAVQVFDYLLLRDKETRPNRLTNQLASRLTNSREDFINRKDAWLGFLNTLYNPQSLLLEPNSDLSHGQISSRYYQLHLRSYNLTQAMTDKERENNFRGCISTYGEEFARREQLVRQEGQEPILTKDIFEHLGLDPADYLKILEASQSSPYDLQSKLPLHSAQQPLPSAPSSYLCVEEDSNNERWEDDEDIPFAIASFVTDLNDESLLVGTATTFNSQHNEEEEEEEEEKSNNRTP